MKDRQIAIRIATLLSYHVSSFDFDGDPDVVLWATPEGVAIKGDVPQELADFCAMAQKTVEQDAPLPSVPLRWRLVRRPRWPHGTALMWVA